MHRTKRRRATNRLDPKRRETRVRIDAVAGSAALVPPRVRSARSGTRHFKLLYLLLVLGLSGLFLTFINLDLFRVSEPNITGIQILTQEEVARASGALGQSIFFIDARSIERELRELPEVKSARVGVGFPNRLTIDVEEREPEIAWWRGADMYFVDGEGTVLQPRATAAELVTVLDLDREPVQIGDQISPAALGAYRALRAAWPDGPRVLEWSAARGLAYTDEHGWKIYFGNQTAMAGKLTRMRVLVQHLVAQNANIKFIDLGKGDPYYQ